MGGRDPPVAKKTTRKTTSNKKVSAKKPASKKKTSAKKKPAVVKKAPAKKKVSTGKKTTKKKTTTKTESKKKVSKQKAPAKKKAPASKKKTTKKTISKKSPAKKTKEKKSNKAPVSKADSKKTTTKKKKKKKAATSGTVKIGRGRSVAEVATTAVADEQGYVIINGRRVRMISTKGMTTKKKTRTKVVVESPVESTEAARKKIKTHLSRKELNHYKKLLLLKRGEIVGDLSSIETEALRSNSGDLSTMPIHMADIGSDTYEQDFMLGMAESERQRIREIDEALMRIKDRTYGVCQMTGEPIPTARLDAKPWAKYTIEAAREQEGQWNPR